MASRKVLNKELADLERRAKERLGNDQEHAPDSGAPKENMHRLIHELDVQKIELEIQQEELVQSREDLEKSLRQYTELYDLAPVGYLTLDRDKKIRQVNRTASRMLDVECTQLVGARFDRLINAEDEPALRCFFDDLFAGKPASACEVRLKRDGLQFGNDPVTVRIDAVIDEGHLECRMALTDVSEQKKVLKVNMTLQTAMARAMKMESLGRLAGGVAHDFNNMLQVMLANIDFMMLDKPHQPFNPEKMSSLRQYVMKSAKLTRQLLAFASSQPSRLEILDFSVMVEDMLKMLRRLIGENITLKYTPPGERLLVKMDPSQIDQILTNLTINARDAIQKGGTIHISTSGITIGSASPPVADMPPGDYVVLSVADDGSGIDTASIENIFEPFYTTKSLVEGTGLGLASVYGIIRQNSGFVHVSSQLGRGSTFHVYLPKYDGDQAGPTLSDNIDTVPKGTETILLVEDEDAVLVVLAEFLEHCGYTVIRAATPADALNAFDEARSPIDLLVTDMIMPGMNGRVLTKKIQQKKRALPSLLMTGYTSDLLVEDNAITCDMPFICKPFTLSRLATAVRAALDVV
jgi:PAS domain S-box-containing protein